MSIKRTYNRAPGFIGDHYIIDVAAAHGYELDDDAAKWRDYVGTPDHADWGEYDLAISAIAEASVQFIRDKGHAVTEEDE
jgi:hypothetical protein